MSKMGGKRDGAGRKRKENGRIKPVSVGMTDEMYLAMFRRAKERGITFQKMIRKICSQFIENNPVPEDKNVK
jgi:hypothetical protein